MKRSAAFDGAKAAIWIGPRLLLYRRDSRVALIWNGLWDFPGGGREGTEEPHETLERELREEFGLDLAAGEIFWRRSFPPLASHREETWFFVVRFPEETEAAIRFGSEGQFFRLFEVEDVMALTDIVPHLPGRLRVALDDLGGLEAFKPIKSC